MASLAAASMASMPTADIAALQAQLLECRPPSTDATRKIAENNTSALNDDLRDSQLQESQHVSQLSPSKTASQSSLLLRHARSAPPVMKNTMDNGKISQPRLLATTFHGGLGGDTQVNDTQVYRHFQEQAADEAVTVPGNPLPMAVNSLDHAAFTNPGAVSLSNGASFLDLNFSPDGKSDVSEMNSVLASPQSQPKKSTARRGSFPETPQLAGHKRARDGQIMTSEARSEDTPGFDALFGPAKTPLLTTTQLFQRTQAASSPLPEGVRSDPVLTRPSPNFQDNLIITSHPGYSSSPNLAQHNAPSSTALEPRDKYVSMLESQNRRTQIHATKLHDVPEDDDVFDNADAQRLEHMQFQRVLSEQALAECRSVSAPARPGSSTVTAQQMQDLRADVSHRHLNGSMSSPQQARAGPVVGEDVREPIDISDDEDTSSVSRDNDHAQPGGSNDAYDEFAQAVVRSSARSQEHHPVEPQELQACNKQLETVPDDNPGQDEGPVESNNEGDVVPGSQLSLNTGKVFHTTQPTSLVGSQTVPQSERRSLLSASHQQPSSITSVVPGSQYPLNASHELSRLSQRAASLSTVLPRQPTRVASSPPLPEPLDDAEDMDADLALKHGSLTRSKVAAKSQHFPIHHVKPSTEVLDSDTAQHTSHLARSGAVAPFSSAVGEVESGLAYATAPSQPSPPRNRRSSQDGFLLESQQSMATPLRRAGARRAADIAEMLTQHTTDLDLSAEIDDAAEVLNELEEYARELSPSLHRKRENPPALDPRAKKRRKTERTVMSSNSTPSSGSRRQAETSDRISQGRMDDSAILPDHEQSVDREDAGSGQDDLADDEKAAEIARGALTIQSPENVRDRSAFTAISPLVATRHTRYELPAKLSGPGKRTYSRKDRLRQSNASKVPQQASEQPPTVTDTADADQTSTTSAADMMEQAAGTTTDHVIAAPHVRRPDRVFALFKDSRAMYYPATMTGQPTDAGIVHVRFDDGSESNVKSTQVAPLDLRRGDVFKVDVKSMRNNWVVQGFHQTDELDSDTAERVDVYGHSTVLVLPRGGKRASLPTKSGQELGAVKVNVADIYLSQTMLSAYRARGLIVPPPKLQHGERLTTPNRTTTTSTDVSTPKSRSGRQAARKQQYILPSSSGQTDELIRAPKPRKSGNVFNNMAFAVTSSSNTPDNEAAREDWIDEIQANGGIVLDDFAELFEAWNVLPRQLGRGEQQADTQNATMLKLKPAFESLGFVALISDKHCRKTKYTQALALGLPTLSSRWIVDSLDKSRELGAGAAGTLSWSKYLLPAGESAYLEGAIRSQTLDIYLPSHAILMNTVASRQLLLNGSKVLIVMPRKDRSSLAVKRQSYAFLTLAIGAGDIRSVEDIEEAAKVVTDDESWSYVMVDSNVEEAAENFDGDNTRNKKKRRSVVENDGALSMKSRDGAYTIISHEFVMQSLILGALVE